MNTIVLIRPILLEILAEAQRDKADKIWAKKNINASESTSKPKLALNQYATKPWIIKEPAKWSRLNNPTKGKMVFLDGSVNGFVHRAEEYLTSIYLERKEYVNAPKQSKIEKNINIILIADKSETPNISTYTLGRPAVSAPSAAHDVPTIL